MSNYQSFGSISSSIEILTKDDTMQEMANLSSNIMDKFSEFETQFGGSEGGGGQTIINNMTTITGEKIFTDYVYVPETSDDTPENAVVTKSYVTKVNTNIAQNYVADFEFQHEVNCGGSTGNSCRKVSIYKKNDSEIELYFARMGGDGSTPSLTSDNVVFKRAYNTKTHVFNNSVDTSDINEINTILKAQGIHVANVFAYDYDGVKHIIVGTWYDGTNPAKYSDEQKSVLGVWLKAGEASWNHVITFDDSTDKIKNKPYTSGSWDAIAVYKETEVEDESEAINSKPIIYLGVNGHCGSTIVRSTDGGQNWTDCARYDLNSNNLGKTVNENCNALFYDKDTKTIYAGCQKYLANQLKGMYSSTDGINWYAMNIDDVDYIFPYGINKVNGTLVLNGSIRSTGGTNGSGILYLDNDEKKWKKSNYLQNVNTFNTTVATIYRDNNVKYELMFTTKQGTTEIWYTANGQNWKLYKAPNGRNDRYLTIYSIADETVLITPWARPGLPCNILRNIRTYELLVNDLEHKKDIENLQLQIDSLDGTMNQGEFIISNMINDKCTCRGYYGSLSTFINYNLIDGGITNLLSIGIYATGTDNICPRILSVIPNDNPETENRSEVSSIELYKATECKAARVKAGQPVIYELEKVYNDTINPIQISDKVHITFLNTLEPLSNLENPSSAIVNLGCSAILSAPGAVSDPANLSNGEPIIHAHGASPAIIINADYEVAENLQSRLSAIEYKVNNVNTKFDDLGFISYDMDQPQVLKSPTGTLDRLGKIVGAAFNLETYSLQSISKTFKLNSIVLPTADKNGAGNDVAVGSNTPIYARLFECETSSNGVYLATSTNHTYNILNSNMIFEFSNINIDTTKRYAITFNTKTTTDGVDTYSAISCRLRVFSSPDQNSGNANIISVAETTTDSNTTATFGFNSNSKKWPIPMTINVAELEEIKIISENNIYLPEITDETPLNAAVTKQYVDNIVSDITTGSGFITETELTNTLSSYPTKTELTNTLSSYPTKTELTNTLSSYPTKTELTNTLSSYPTKTEAIVKGSTVNVLGGSLNSTINITNRTGSAQFPIFRFNSLATTHGNFNSAHYSDFYYNQICFKADPNSTVLSLLFARNNPNSIVIYSELSDTLTANYYTIDEVDDLITTVEENIGTPNVIIRRWED